MKEERDIFLLVSQWLFAASGLVAAIIIVRFAVQGSFFDAIAIGGIVAFVLIIAYKPIFKAVVRK